MLSTRTATALYVGAVLGPGVLIVPAAAAIAFAAVLVLLAFSGPFVLVPATIAALYAAFSMTAASRSTAVASSACAR